MSRKGLPRVVSWAVYDRARGESAGGGQRQKQRGADRQGLKAHSLSVWRGEKDKILNVGPARGTQG